MRQDQRSNANSKAYNGLAGVRAAFWSTPLRSSFFGALVLVVWALCLFWAIDHSLSSSRSRPVADAQLQNRLENETEKRVPDRKRTKKKSEETRKSSADPAEKKQNPKSSQTKPSKENQSTGGERTYSFVGSVSKSVPEIQSRNNAAAVVEGSSSEGSSEGESGKGDSRVQEDGQVPELTIRVTKENIEAVAGRFDYQMAAMTASGDAVLGKVERGALRPTGKEELSRYAGRARSARKHPEYQRLRREVARQLPRQEASSIKLIYLVPKRVEQRFAEVQMEALRRQGISPGDVAKMEARPQGQSIEIVSIKRK